MPEDGIVRFPCPTENYPRIRGEVDLPNTIYVEGLEGFFRYYSAFRHSCGHSISTTGARRDYLSWRNLNDVIPIVEDSFGYLRGPVKWKANWQTDGAYYSPDEDRIVFGDNAYHEAWVVGHEYTHALHHKAMGGSWETENCGYRESRAAYTCAFQEGLANYGGWVGVSDDATHWDWDSAQYYYYPLSPQREWSVAALFHDLMDDPKYSQHNPDSILEPKDKTSYSTSYVMDVFATCEVKPRGRRSAWEKRNDVSDFVWCLENRFDAGYHTHVFPGIPVPQDVREGATEPADWNPDSIRSTWLWNLCDDCQ